MLHILCTLWMPLSLRAWTFLLSFPSPFSVSASSDPSISAAASAATTTRCPATGTAVLPRRIASLEGGCGPPLLPAHSLSAASRVWVAPTAGITVATAISIPGAAAIVVIATASATATVGWWGPPRGWGAAWVTCRVNGSGNCQVSLVKRFLLIYWHVPISLERGQIFF